ncbi:unnamed protein product, partial [Didymodactylos carnosus]
VDNIKNNLTNIIDKFGNAIDEGQTKITDSFKGVSEQIKKYLYIAFIIVLLILILLALNLCTNLFMCVHMYCPSCFKHHRNSSYSENNGRDFEIGTTTAMKSHYQQNLSENR